MSGNSLRLLTKHHVTLLRLKDTGDYQVTATTLPNNPECAKVVAKNGVFYSEKILCATGSEEKLLFPDSRKFHPSMMALAKAPYGVEITRRNLISGEVIGRERLYGPKETAWGVLVVGATSGSLPSLLRMADSSPALKDQLDQIAGSHPGAKAVMDNARRPKMLGSRTYQPPTISSSLIGLAKTIGLVK